MVDCWDSESEATIGKMSTAMQWRDRPANRWTGVSPQYKSSRVVLQSDLASNRFIVSPVFIW